MGAKRRFKFWIILIVVSVLLQFSSIAIKNIFKAKKETSYSVNTEEASKTTETPELSKTELNEEIEKLEEESLEEINKSKDEALEKFKKMSAFVFCGVCLFLVVFIVFQEIYNFR